jgi:hypothetical protein
LTLEDSTSLLRSALQWTLPATVRKPWLQFQFDFGDKNRASPACSADLADTEAQDDGTNKTSSEQSEARKSGSFLMSLVIPLAATANSDPAFVFIHYKFA